MYTVSPIQFFFIFFFFNDTATTEIYTLSLHDALPISFPTGGGFFQHFGDAAFAREGRSEEHTSELQSQSNLVCRLLLEKKKKKHTLSHAPTNRASLIEPHSIIIQDTPLAYSLPPTMPH